MNNHVTNETITVSYPTLVPGSNPGCEITFLPVDMTEGAKLTEADWHLDLPLVAFRPVRDVSRSVLSREGLTSRAS